VRATDAQIAHWETAANDAVFTLPIDAHWFRHQLEPGSRILDYGCGYGRILAQLDDLGFAKLAGVDASAAMLERARQRLPAADLRVCRGTPTPHADASFDAVLLIAVLTCVPADADQQALVEEIRRLLRPGGLLYLCDFLLRSDDRNLQRYREQEPVHGTYGVFALDDGLPLRHHDPAWVRELLRPFESLEFESFEATTMLGNPATGFRFAGRKPFSQPTAS